jgi:hypothetical protein
MSENTAETPTPAAEAPAVKTTKPEILRDYFLYALLLALTWGTWKVTQLKLFTPGDDFGYWLGVVGGSMMALLLIYSIRKHLPFARKLGDIKIWLWVHMSLGIFGPTLIVLHSAYSLRSLNAAAAFYSMMIVAISGVIGRFILLRIRGGLATRAEDLKLLKEHAAGTDLERVRSRLGFAPNTKTMLEAFEKEALNDEKGWMEDIRRVTILPIHRMQLLRKCTADMAVAMRRKSDQKGWNEETYQRRLKRHVDLVDDYARAIVRMSQFMVWTRLFALWHIAHIPFVYLLIVTAIVHVYAVHIY